MPVAFGLPDEQGFPHQGKMDAADSRIDPSTGTARCCAVLPNKDGMLSPGMFVRVRLATSALHRAIVVPKIAVASEGPFIRNIVRWYVLTVNDQNVVERRDVEPHVVTDDDRSVYVKGLAVDDLVITSPVYPLKPGMTVTPEKAETGAKYDFIPEGCQKLAPDRTATSGVTEADGTAHPGGVAAGPRRDPSRVEMCLRDRTGLVRHPRLISVNPPGSGAIQFQ